MKENILSHGFAICYFEHRQFVFDSHALAMSFVSLHLNYVAMILEKLRTSSRLQPGICDKST